MPNIHEPYYNSYLYIYNGVNQLNGLLNKSLKRAWEDTQRS